VSIRKSRLPRNLQGVGLQRQQRLVQRKVPARPQRIMTRKEGQSVWKTYLTRTKVMMKLPVR
jgi:hypothetical protein